MPQYAGVAGSGAMLRRLRFRSGSCPGRQRPPSVWAESGPSLRTLPPFATNANSPPISMGLPVARAGSGRSLRVRGGTASTARADIKQSRIRRLCCIAEGLSEADQTGNILAARSQSFSCCAATQIYAALQLEKRSFTRNAAKNKLASDWGC